jgi:peptidoglycan/xylan/chitin deacetylase (PgdA/CDA1 family)
VSNHELACTAHGVKLRAWYSELRRWRATVGGGYFRAMKRAAFAIIRSIHKALFKRALPRNVAIYGHALEERDQKSLAEVIQYFRDSEYVFSTPDEYVANRNGQPRVFLSFDDNYRSWFQALEFLARFDIPVTFYVNAGPLRDSATSGAIEDFFGRIRHEGDRTTLSSDELRSLASAGHVIGSHTDWHYPLTRIPFETAKQAIRHGKTLLDQILERETAHFSYPFGTPRDFNSQLAAYCRTVGIRTIASATAAMQHQPREPGVIHRSLWRFEHSLEYNLDNIRIDGRLFTRLTGRSAVG